jgi:hypothetical protein
MMIVVAVAAVASEMAALYAGADQEEREDAFFVLVLAGFLILVFGTVALVLSCTPGPERP